MSSTSARAAAKPPASRTALRRQVALLVGLVITAVSTYVLYVLIGEEGVAYSADGRRYMGAAISLLRQGVMVLYPYTPETGVVEIPLTHYPPLTTLSYYVLMRLGVGVHDAPAVVSLICWPLFLTGTGALTYRLSRSGAVAVLAVALACITYHHLRVFTTVRSEVIFLPLLVWAMASLVDLPRRRGGAEALKGWAVASALLASLMLTRYPGGFVWLAAGAWWAGWRLWQGRLLERSALKEGALLAAAVVPLGLWLARNVWLTGSPLSRHLSESKYGFVDGVEALVLQSSQLVWPAVRGPGVFHVLGFERLPMGGLIGYLLLYVVPAMAAAYGAWRCRERLRGYLFRSPIEVTLFVYLIGLYVFVQPFAEFFPMDIRDMATGVALLFPWLFGAGAVLLRRRRRLALLGGYVLVNLALLLLMTFHRGRPDFIRLAPPEVQSLAGQDEAVAAYNAHYMPNWLMLGAWRSRVLETYHPELLAHLKPGTFVFTNVNTDRFFAPQPMYARGRVQDWIDYENCALPGNRVVAIFTWDEWEETSRALERAIDRQCPGLTKETFEHSIFYTSGDAEAK